MKTYNYLFGLLAFLLMAAGCGKDEPDVKIEPPVFNLQQSSAVEAVDLGLSVLWSNCNMGASSPRDDGGYFAWATQRAHCGRPTESVITTTVTRGTPTIMAATRLWEVLLAPHLTLLQCIGVVVGMCPPMMNSPSCARSANGHYWSKAVKSGLR